MQMSQPSYQTYLSQQLDKQYHQICFNPSKRQTLNRLLHRNSENNNPYSAAKERKSNLLDNHHLLFYVNGLYQKYGIEDPIKKHLRLSSAYRTDTTPQKSQNMTQITDSDRLTRTKRRLLSLKESFKRDSEHIVESSQFNLSISYRDEHSTISLPKKNKQIGYKTKDKIKFKTITNQQTHPHPTYTAIPRPQSGARHSEPVRQSYQYCIMCQQKIEQSIQTHLPKCKQGIQAYLPDQLLKASLSTKIKRMQQQIGQILYFKNQQNILFRFRDLRSTIHEWINTQHVPFQSIRDKFQFYSLDLYQRLSKLNWFRKMHLRMRQRRVGQMSV